MGGIFGGFKPPQTQSRVVAPPSRSDADVQAAETKERQRRRALVGRASTNLTGDQGDTSQAPVTKTLLGGATQAVGA